MGTTFKSFVWVLWVVMLFLLTQFSGTVVYNLAVVAYKMLYNPIFGIPAQWLAGATGFNTYTGFFWGKMAYTLLIGICMLAALWFYARSWQEFRLCLWLLGAAVVGILVANIASKVLKSTWLQTFSRDMLEVLTSPFPVLFIIPVLVLYRNTTQGPKTQTGTLQK